MPINQRGRRARASSNPGSIAPLMASSRACSCCKAEASPKLAADAKARPMAVVELTLRQTGGSVTRTAPPRLDRCRSALQKAAGQSAAPSTNQARRSLHPHRGQVTAVEQQCVASRQHCSSAPPAAAGLGRESGPISWTRRRPTQDRDFEATVDVAVLEADRSVEAKRRCVVCVDVQKGALAARLGQVMQGLGNHNFA